MKENLDRNTRIYALTCISAKDEIDIYLGTVDNFIFMDKDIWEMERLHIITDYAGIKLIGEKERTTTKLWFTSHIDKLKGINRGQ